MLFVPRELNTSTPLSQNLFSPKAAQPLTSATEFVAL